MNVTAALSETPDPEPCLQVPAEPDEKRVPAEARLWGFVRRSANEKDDSASLRETDVGLWLDEERYRFLVAAGQDVKDDLAPLEFIQFIRELKHSHSQTLFKLGNSFERSPRRATVVWSRPVATLIPFPSKLQLLAKDAARPNRTEAARQQNSGSLAVMVAASRRISPAALRRIGAGPIARY